MKPQEIAQAYHLLNQIMLVGMTDELLLIVNQLPEFADLDPKSRDDWTADHYTLFGMNVFPFETVFLAEDGLLGGDITEAVARAYYDAGYKPDESEPADHIGNQLGLMAWLCDEEAKARQDDVAQAIHHMTHLQRKFLDEHLLCWLPALVMSIHRQDNEWFSILADRMLRMVFTHRQSLGDDSAYPTQPLTLPSAPKILDDNKTGLSDIADFLLTPVYSGIYLGRDDIARLSIQFDLPRGFGKRHQMLTRLLQTAVEYDAMGDLMQSIQAEVTLWQAFYINEVPDKRFSGAWITRLDETLQFLQIIRLAL